MQILSLIFLGNPVLLSLRGVGLLDGVCKVISCETQLQLSLSWVFGKNDKDENK